MSPVGAVRAGAVGAQVDVIPDSGNLQSAYIADDISGSQGDPVSTWADSEGDDDATQATASNQPTLNTDDLNGHNTVSFDGGDFLDTGFTQDTDNPRSLYVVYKYDTGGQNDRVYGARDNSEPVFNIIGKIAGNAHRVGYGDSADADTAIQTNNFEIRADIGGSGTHETYINGTSAVSLPYTASGSVGFSDYIGARNDAGTADLRLDGKIVEILRYGDIAHDASTRGEVESYLDGRYSILP